MPIHSPLRQLLDRVRVREITRLAVDKGALALVIFMGGVIALLLAGTDILGWYWLALLTAAGLGVGVYLLRRNLSSQYVLAQRIDRKLQLADAISTALYFADHPQPEKTAICESQLRQAESLAAGVDVRLALPFTRSRYLAPAALLAAVAFGLFGVRYLVTGTLDLRASLVRAVYDDFFGSKVDAKNQLAKRAKFNPLTGEPNQNASVQDGLQPEDLLDSQDSTEATAASQDNSKSASQDKSQKKGDTPGEGEDKSDKSGKGNDSQDQNSNNQASQNGKDSKSNDGGKQQAGKSASGGEKSQSLLDKMRDALSNLMDKMKQNDEGSRGDPSQQQSKPGEKRDQADKSQPSKDKQSQASSDQDSGQQAQGDQQSDASNDKKATDKSQSQDSKNGIGSQDGEKAIKEAEQLKAMGKISEILGKRSAAVSGEVMVEVGSGKQQLKTPWAPLQANHSNAGGEIHRDEIPLIEQQFIERYFEEVHKPVAPAKKNGDG